MNRKYTKTMLCGALLLGCVLVGCGPNKKMIRLQNQVATLRAEKAREVAKLQKEKFEAMQVQRVALEQQQKNCKTQLVHMRKRHRILSYRVAKATRKMQQILMQIMSETLLMPFHEDAAPTSPEVSVRAAPQDSSPPPPVVVAEPKPKAVKKDDKGTKTADTPAPKK